MYTISKGPSQIVAKTRRGLAQKLESLESIRDMTRKNSDSDSSDSMSSLSPPRPVFHPLNKANKRMVHSASHRHHHPFNQQPDSLTRSQEELMRYIYERWQRVNRELNTMSNAEGTTVTYYQDANPNPALQDFEPFDLEGWWGRRLYHTLTQSI